MTELTRETFTQGWSLLEKHYRRTPATKDLLKLYYGIFKGLTDEQFHEGVRQTLLAERFLPPLQTIIDYGKSLTKSLPPEHRLFIAPAEDNYDPESAAMTEARNRARGIVQSVASALTPDESPSPPDLAVGLDGLAGLLEDCGPDAVQQRLEMLNAQGVVISMSAVEARHTELYGDPETIARLGALLSENFLSPPTTEDVKNSPGGSVCQG